ncbi:MAG: hypothetical protein HQ483_14195 [Rhodospirillales bacterium]|nr:hypothetical protein [Rhodospirillales bacterium]
MRANIELSLKPQNRSTPNGNSEQNQEPEETPVMGWFAVAFGILGIFTFGVIFVPLGLVCSVLAFLFGQVSWAISGLVLAVIGFVTSPHLWLIVGLAAAYQGLGLHEQLQPFFDMMGIEPPPGVDV